MTEKQFEYCFLTWDTANNFRPDSVTYPHEYKGESKLNIACTQILGMTPTQQKKLVKEWIAFLPNCKEIEMLWFSTQLSQQLFDSVCKLKNLIGLNIKWSNIIKLDNISNLTNLKYLRFGSSARIESIKPLITLTNLEVLTIENFNKISDFAPLSKLTNLKFLTIEGGMYTKQKVDSFEPISKLTNLIYFSTAMISCVDKRIDPILNLKNLLTLNWAFDIPKKDMERLKTELPKLKYLPHRNYEENMKKIKATFG